jgi:dTDP-4-dehydrorhamnose 3,5-epimerase-like enzyme
MIPGVEVRTLRRLDDARGFFVKLVQAHHLEGHPFGEAYVSSGGPGEKRACHYHERTTEWFSPVAGRGTLYLAAVDGEARQAVRMDIAAPVCVRIPPRVAHALVADEGCELAILAIADVEYDPQDPDTFPAPFERIAGSPA